MQRLFFSAAMMVLLAVGGCSDRGGGGAGGAPAATSGLAMSDLLARRLALIGPCHTALNEVRLGLGSSDPWRVVQSRAREARRPCRGLQRTFETLQVPADQPAAAAMRTQCVAAYQSAISFLNDVVRTNEARSGPQSTQQRYQTGSSRSRGTFENPRRQVYLNIDGCSRAARALDGSAPAATPAPAEDAAPAEEAAPAE